MTLWADRLRDISSVGLMFADTIYHRQRYEMLCLAWFTETNLPSALHAGHARRIPEAFCVWRGDPRAYFGW